MKNVFWAGMSMTMILTACGGGSSQATYREQVSSLLTLSSETETIVQTPVASLPTTGSADYAGVAFVTADTDLTNQNVALSLIGDMNVTADFAARRVTGSADNFRGATVTTDPNAPDPQTVDDIDFSQIDESDYAGTMDISGTISAATGAIDGTLSGTFTGAGNTVVVSSTTASGYGAFGGANHEYLAMESADNVRVNGTDITGFSGIIGKR